MATDDGAERRDETTTPEVDPATALGTGLAGAADRAGLGAIARGDELKPGELLGALGGFRGLAEAIVPGLVFLVVYTLSPKTDQGLFVALAASVGLAVVFTVIRLVTRSQPSQAIAGLVAVGASAALALWTGNGRDNFVIGLWTNVAYAVAILISLLVRWPVIGLAVGFLMNDGVKWRNDRRRYRAMQILTISWLGLFVARLAVQAPLYFANNVEALAATKLIMGVPLYAILLVVSWLIVRAVYPSRPATAE